MFESSKFISPFVYSELAKITALVDVVLKAKTVPPELPNVFALLSRAGAVVDRVRRWQYVRAGLVGSAEYFREMFVLCETVVDEGDSLKISFRQSVDLFRFARLFDPVQALKILAVPDFSLESWRATAVQVIEENLWTAMMQDLPKYVSVCRERVAEERAPLDPQTLLEWFKVNSGAMGAWATAASSFVLLRPSSALVERIFSIWQSCLPEESLLSLEETQELRMQLNFARIEAGNK